MQGSGLGKYNLLLLWEQNREQVLNVTFLFILQMGFGERQRDG